MDEAGVESRGQAGCWGCGVAEGSDVVGPVRVGRWVLFGFWVQPGWVWGRLEAGAEHGVDAKGSRAVCGVSVGREREAVADGAGCGEGPMAGQAAASVGAGSWALEGVEAPL